MSARINRVEKTFDAVQHGLGALVCGGLAVLVIGLYAQGHLAWWFLFGAVWVAGAAVDSAASLYRLLRGRLDEFYVRIDTEAGEQ
ncbi:hypothetical protein [Prauserella alba]|uniref:2TM domain-containing protein n=1 Tax=Prauserella alba TaxID=176898 RepID=A0ABN1VH80_9PSEU|nr:hypothetical protein [Prauserella alba]MCP2180023.1 hypothetical protein [Prauserella alba]